MSPESRSAEDNMETLLWMAIAAVYGALFLIAGRALYRLWAAAMREDRPLLMHRMLDRQGLSLGRLVGPAELAQAAAAVRRCILCRQRETCVAWLDRKARTGYERFCPNSDFIASLKGRGPRAIRLGRAGPEAR
jgi:hypothetical protein